MIKPNISEYNAGMLEDYVFPGTDAAVVFVPTDSPPKGLLKTVLDRAHASRWYPAEGGHNVKIPYHLAEGAEQLFRKETKGWDHEHCDFCGADIHIGELSWTVPHQQGVVVFCKACREKLKT